MTRTPANLRRLEAVAASQHQAFTRAQATEAGFTRAMQHWRRSEGHWVVLLPGVYRFASATPSFRMRCAAAAQWSAPDGMISHLTGGAVWELEGVRRPVDIEVLLPADRRIGCDGVVVHRSADLLPTDRSARFGIPVASALRVILDIASRVDEATYELAVEDALRRRLFTVGQLEWRAARRTGKGHPGSRVIAELIRRHGSTVTDSGWGVRVEHALAHGGLARPQRQVAVDTSLGTLHVDLAYPGPPSSRSSTTATAGILVSAADMPTCAVAMHSEPPA